MRIPILILVCLLPFAAPRTDAFDRVQNYPIKQVGCHTYVIYGALGSPTPQNQGYIGNSGFIITKKGVVIIDPGSSLQAGRMVLRKVSEVTDRPVTHVINTHSHGEHWLGNHAVVEAFPEVRILAHHRMLKELSWKKALDWIEYMEHMTDGFTKGTRLVPPNEPVEHLLHLFMGDVTLRIGALDDGFDNTSVIVEVAPDSVAFVGEEIEIEHLDLPAGEDGTDLPAPLLCEVVIPAGTEFYIPDHGPAGPAGVVECPDYSVMRRGHLI